MRADGKVLLISIRPRFADMILGGSKTVELRRIRPAVEEGDRVLLYASSPVRELIGSCTVAGVDVGTANELWKSHGAHSGVSRAEFDRYFEGASRAVGISLREPRRVRRPRTLAELRKRLPGFSPPQSFGYLSAEDVDRLDIELDPLARGAKRGAMESAALTRWRTGGLARLAELEGVHANLVGSGAGRKWGTSQLNRSLFLALVAQFQSYCRDLHDEAARVHVEAAIPGQKQTLHLLIRQGRRLDTHNPRRSVLGHDFGRLGFSLLEDLKATGPDTIKRLERLDTLVDYRNAIGHGDEPRIATLEASGIVKATKKSYTEHRRSLEALAGTIDATVAAGLARVLGTVAPW